MSNEKTNKEGTTIEIDLVSPADLGLDSPPSKGEPCSREGETTCGPYGEVLKCVDYIDCR